ncbi:TPA: hypothetical protein QIC26_000030 [Klebsiella aerogenes]|nr:hypothetical protein [Klebsiella aerogenes]
MTQSGSTKIETKSNLHSEVLRDLCLMFDFDFNRFKDLTSILDRLVHVRNCIAHGENSILPTQENIDSYIETVKSAIDIMMDEIDKFLTQENYLFKQPS